MKKEKAVGLFEERNKELKKNMKSLNTISARDLSREVTTLHLEKTYWDLKASGHKKDCKCIVCAQAEKVRVAIEGILQAVEVLDKKEFKEITEYIAAQENSK